MRPILLATILATGITGLTLLAKELVPAGGGAPVIQNGAAINPAEVKGLVEQLGSANFREREAAGATLLSAGDRVLPQLKDAVKTVEDPEANRRLQMIVETLETNRLVTARTITLKLQGKSAKAVIEEIEKQSGYTLQYSGGSDESKKFSYDWTDMPYWQALDKVCEDAGLQANPNGNDGAMSLYNSGQTISPFVGYSGPFKIMASNISMSRSLQLANIPRNGANHQNEYNNLNLTVHSEPKAPIVSVGQAKLTRAVDENGVSLLVPENPNNGVVQSSHYYGGGYYRQYYQSFSVNLVRPNRNAERIKEVRGKVPVTILSETRPELVVDDILKVKDKKFVARTAELHIKSADYANDTLTIELTASRRNATTEDYNWSYGVTQKFQVTDANGKAYIFNGVQSQQNGNNTTTVTLQYRHPYNKKLGKPARFEYQEWFTITREVEFAFKDIPLP